MPQPADHSSLDPGRLAERTQWHRTLANLPDEEHEIVNLLWYHGMSQQEATQILSVFLRTVKRRWQKARLMLQEILPPKAGEDSSTVPDS